MVYFRIPFFSSAPPPPTDEELVDQQLRAAGSQAFVDADPALGEDRDIRISRLWIHPIKSCRGIDLKQSRYTPRGLEFDRHWAVRDATTQKMVTAREEPKMVLVTPEVDEEQNLLHVKFPEDAGLPGFSVRLRTSSDDVEVWEQLEGTIMHSKVLPPSLLCPSPLPHPPRPILPSPSDQFSTYLGRPAQFMQFLPPGYLLNGRPPRVTTPPVAEPEELGYEVGEAGFADKYPVLIATEESFQDVQASVTAAISPNPPAHLRGIGKTLDTAAWVGRELKLQRFRPNIILSGTGQAWDEDRWKEVAFFAGEGAEMETEGMDVDSPQEEEDEEDALRMKAARGVFICTSRCGRCQLPNVDPVTGVPDKAVPYKIIAKYRRVDPEIKYTPCFGVNAMPQRESGMLRVGDKVQVVRLNDWEVLEVESKE